MKKYSLSALAAAGLLAGGLSVTSASAADLGGNCCADLEERIAELEATTARKGNRKVSLTISGWVGQQVMYWDDGIESNTYVHDLGLTLASNVKFSGQATISPGWTAGYLMHIEFNSNDGLVGIGTNRPAAERIDVLQSYWFIKSDHLGKVSVGAQSQASDNAAILVDGSGSLVPANWVLFDLGGFSIRRPDGTTPGTWAGANGCHGMGGVAGDCHGNTHNSVRYDSPTFAGFSVSAGWGEDDFWDVAARYAGEFSGFKIAAVVAYNEITDGFVYPGVQNNETVNYLQAGLYIQHVPSGIFGLVNYGTLDSDGAAAAVHQADDAETWYFKAGLRQRWNHLGHTVLYGEYLQNENSGSLALTGTSTETTLWGAGIVQEIDNAAMSIWIKYRNLEYEDNVAGSSFEEFDELAIGGLINF